MCSYDAHVGFHRIVTKVQRENFLSRFHRQTSQTINPGDLSRVPFAHGKSNVNEQRYFVMLFPAIIFIRKYMRAHRKSSCSRNRK